MKRATAARVGLVASSLAIGFVAPAPASAHVPGIAKCGAHALTLGADVVFDGKSIARTATAPVFPGRPAWRSDCAGVAWIQRSAGVTSLIVLTASGADVVARSWSLPPIAMGDRVFWADAKTVTVGEDLLNPRVIARFP
jgi:hypothetical protein